ncbi:hypothetical protein FWF93_00745 [Candidatus Saccharibacteria bacterium]|nr:hypothetical protein [Candidatus Saccharibacteria bacterium]
MKHRYLILIGLLLGIGALALIFAFTDPVSIGLFGVVGVFTIVYGIIFCIVYSVAMLITAKINKKREKVRKIRMRKVQYISGVLALAPIFIMSFFSLGAVNLPEVLVVILIEVVAIFFINKRF